MWHIVVGVLVGLLAVYQIYTGSLVVGDSPTDNSTVLRSEKPVYFWIVTVVQILFAAVLISGLIQF
jgi:hypothetical protein